MKDSYPARVSCCTWILCDQHCTGDECCEKTGLHCLKLPMGCLSCPTLALGVCSEWLSLLLRAQHHQGPLWRAGLGVLHIILFHILCPGLPLCCAEVLLGAMKGPNMQAQPKPYLECVCCPKITNSFSHSSKSLPTTSMHWELLLPERDLGEHQCQKG